MSGYTHRVLRPYNPSEAIPPQAAALIARRDQSTIKSWAETFHLGRKLAGRWEISHPALLMFLDGDEEALNAYLSGDRQSERVLGYFVRAGLLQAEAA
jgi:hypothetical protein